MTSASVAYSPLVAGMFLLRCHTLAYLCMYCNVPPPLAVVYNLNIWLYFTLLSPMLMRAVVTELSEIVAVSVENQTVSPGGVGYQVNTWTLFGYSLQLTCTWSVDCGRACTMPSLKSWLCSILYPAHFNAPYGNSGEKIIPPEKEI